MTLKEFSKLFYSLALQLRAGELGDAELRAYYVALKDQPLPLVHAAAERFMHEAQWFPKTSEWREMIRAVEADRRQAQRDATRREGALCAVCEDTGWARTEEHGVPVVSRCACWTARRAERLGVAAPPPPARPPVPSGSDPVQLARIKAAVLPFLKETDDDRGRRAAARRPRPADSGSAPAGADVDGDPVESDRVAR